MDGTSRHRRPANRSSPLLPLRYIKELNLSGSKVVVHTDQREISLTNLKVSSSKAGDSRERIRTYGFDYCFDSSNPETENYANQEKIYETLGKSVLDALFSGYNSCLVAYGQSASGKTYTMMGTKDDPGLTPRLCEGLLSRIDEEKKNERVFHVSVSYLEIYNERVRDLLKPSSSSSRLRVREHPRLGPYVQGLTHHAVQSLDALMSCVEEGARARKTASTLHNSSSSRSHALLTVALSAEDLESVCGSTLGSAGQRRRRRRPGASSTSVASLSNRQDAPPRAAAIKLHLVDLAGSESAATCGGLHRLKEGANINKSLVALGNVISALAERGSTGSGPGKRFIPYRDSSLTWLLKDALGGNATTIMLATISPASGSYNETANTLRFAQRAQSVVNKPMVNEDPVARIIRDLRAEVARLKTLLLEKDIEPQSRVPCCCEQNQRTIDSSRSKDKSSQAEIERTERRETEEKEEREEEDQEEEEEEKEEEEEEEEEQEEERSNPSSRKEGRNCTIGRFNSSESLQTCENGWTGAIRKFGSYEYLGRKDQLFGYNYNRAKVTELNEEEDEIVKEIEEPAFVDIPTLVAVLIKPEDASHETTVQIEEICSDEIAEDSIDRDASIDSNSANSSSRSSIIAIERRGDKTSRFHKQDSIDVAAPTNLRASKRFGSVEGLQKRRDVAPVCQLERSHTNLERSRPSLTSSDGKIKKLNNIREIEDRKLEGSGFWRDLGKLTGKEQVQARPKNNSTRKPSLESLKRKTSKDSSSSSSKDEQILLSSLGASRRKDFIDQELSTRAHTPIQKVKRADIVAAVTERLYSSRKHTEQQEMASSLVSSDVRSPPEGTDMKSTTNVFAARSKLQEISRKMLAKRRRVCVDTQTDSARTVRVKDSASLTEKIDVVLRDVAVLTDEHEECLNRLRINEQRIPVLRVKETSTLTEKMKTVRYKDAESLADDLEFEADSKKPRKGASEFRSSKVESWTDTVALACTARDSTSQTRMEDLVEAKRALRCERECCNLESSARSRNVNEKNVISISLPEIVSITIESANVLESNISVSDVVDERIKSKNMETQTEDKMNEKKEIEKTIVSACSRDSRSNVVGQTDGRGFRIENIFQDPMNASRMCSPASSIFDLTDSCPRRSLIFTNSLGTSFVPDTKESATEMEHARTHGVLVDRPCQVQEQSRVMTDAVVSKRYLFNDSWSTRVHGDGKEAESASLAFWKRSDSNGTSWSTDELLNASENNIATDATVETTTTSLSNDTEVKSPANVRETTNFKRTLLTFQQDSRKILERDYNFSDDSLDCNEENPIDLKSSCKMTGIEVARENICPPDVVAHTKKETPRSLAYAEKDDVQLDPMSDFEDSHVEFPRRKPCEMDACYSINDYKSLIMGTTSHEANEILFTEGATCLEGKASSRPGQARKKKVSFSTFSSVMGECEAQLKPPNLDKFDKTNLPKSIIKETKKTKSSRLNVASDDVDFSNDETNNFEESPREKNTSEASYEEDTNSAKAESESESFDYSQNSEDSSEVAGGKKVRFSKADVSEDACSDSESDVSGNEDGLTVKLKRNILEKYMNEAATFMRNINSINEYMTASNAMETYMGRNVKRHEDSHKRCRHDRDYVEYKGRRIRLSDRDDDEVDDRNDITVPTESYQKCLEGIERLQNCIEQVDRHNEYLRERYGIIVESADAKSTLARSSTDSRRNEGDASRRDERGRLKAGGFSKIRSSSYRAAFEEAPKRVEEKKPEDEDHRRSDSSENFDDNFFDEPTSDLYRYWSVRRLRRKRCGKPPPAGKSKNLRSYLKIRERRETKGFSPEDKTEDEEEDEVEVEVENSQKFGGRSSVASPYESEMVALGRTRFHDVSDAGECAELPDNIASENSRDEFSRRIRSRRERFSSSRMESAADVDCLGSCGSFLACARPICGSVRSKNKLRYSGSPKAKFLELLRERRRIVESSRATSAS